RLRGNVHAECIGDLRAWLSGAPDVACRVEILQDHSGRQGAVEMEDDRELGGALEAEMRDIGREDGGRGRRTWGVRRARRYGNTERQIALSNGGQGAVRRQAVFERFEAQRSAAAHARP